MASMIPTRKVTGGGLAGALVTILVKVLSDAFNYDIDGEYAAALTVVFTFAVSYLIPEKVDAA